MDRLQAANPVVPPQASPTAHLRMTVEPYLNECTPLLDDADSYLQFHIDETLSSMEQISSLQQARRAASYACVLLKEKEQCLRTLFDEWKDIIRSLSPEDSEETVHSEYSSFQAMSVNPNGLRATLSHVTTIIHKLHFLDEDLHDLEDRIRSNLSPAPSRQLLQSPQLSATTTQQKAEPPIIQRQPSQVSTDAYVQSTHLPNTITARLPQLQLPTFDGKPGEWFEFWQLFEATVDIHPLANVEKFAYLTSCLRGQAKLVAAGYPRRAESYRPLIDALHQQFGNLDALERSLQVQLRQLRNPTHTSTDLKEFHNDVSRILNHMRIADIDTEQRQILFELEEHLPEATRLLMYSSKRKCVNYSTSDFLRILLETAQMLEAVQPLARFSSRSEHANQSIMPTRRNIPQLSMRSFASSSPNQTASSNKFRQQRFSNINQQPPPVNFSRQQQSTNLIRNSRQTPTVPCAFCNAAHWHSECRLYSTIQQRNNRARQLNLCFKCLKPGHTTLNCPRSRNCYYCHGPHNTVLCSMQATQRPAISHTHLAVAETIPNATSSNSAAVTTSQHNVIQPSTVLLLWGTTKTYNPILPQSLKTTRVFLDQGSQTTFVTERFAKSLGFSLNNKKPLIIHGVGDVDGNQYNSAKIFFGIRLADGSNHIVEASTLPKVTAKFLHASITPKDLPTLWNDMSSEFPLPLYEDEPDILIGSNFVSIIDLHAIKQLRCGFTLYDSTIGPIIGGAGRVPTTYRRKHSSQVNAVLVGNVTLSVEDLWSLDALGITLNDESVTDDQHAMNQFNSSIQRLPNGRYSVFWPWKTTQPDLSINFGLCVGRLQSLLRTLSANPEQRINYQKLIQQQLDSSIIERAPLQPSGPQIHYIPHQAVWNEQKRKLRIVYDASSSAPKGHALNDNLLRGPVFLPDMVGQLLRFRQAPIVLIADVEKAFHQIELDQTDRDVTRFLWVDHPELPISPNNPIISYRFKRVFFGAKSSPFLLAATIRHHLKHSNSPWAGDILKNIYVDNVLLAANSEKEAIEGYHQAKKLFDDAHMNLHEFLSNNALVNSQIAEKDRYNSQSVKVLGMQWHANTDHLTLTMKPPPTAPITKRSLLRYIAQFFDPLGFQAPVIITYKILLQDITKTGADWDEPLKPQYQNQWSRLQAYYSQSPIKIARLQPMAMAELHIFADASSRAYATAIYFKQENQVTLFYAKARLCPIKWLTIPQLELLAILISVRASNFIIKQLNLVNIKRTIWTDSKCALAWINSGSSEKLSRYVRNRLNEVRLTKDIAYAYVPTEDNPADVATRGLSWENFITEDKWWNGPRWLRNDQSKWPFTPTVPAHGNENTPDPPSKVASNASTVIQCLEPTQFIDAKKFSSWTRLVDIVAWMLRFLHNARHSTNTYLDEISSTGLLSANDRRIAEHYLIRQVQNSSISTKEIQRWQLIQDAKGIWRCHGRLAETVLPRAEQFPIFLPRNDPITHLIIANKHRLLFHAGPAATLAHLRQRFWIPHGRSTVKKVIYTHCMGCKRWTAKPFSLPPMPALPSTRVQPAPAFDHTGIDLCGPVIVKNETETAKRWICLFTCLVTRAVHLEVVENLSAAELVESLKRFSARRGLPRQIISDNGTNLVLTAKCLKQGCATRDVKWSFVTAFAPWRGGVYERLIGLTKNCMRKAVGRRLLTDATLRTFVTEVEAVLNERPLTYVENENIEVLRPIDYLRPRAHLALSMKENAEMEAEFNPHPPSTRQQFLDEWRKSEEYRNKFWIIWSREYLQLLREREQQLHKGPYAQERRTPRIGEVVLLNEQNRPRCMWRLARIVETPEGSGHAIRTARIKLATGRTLVRSIAHLYPLEVTLTDTIANNSTPTPKQTQFVTSLPDPNIQQSDDEDEEPDNHSAIISEPTSNGRTSGLNITSPVLTQLFTHHTTILTIVSLIMLAVPAQSTFSAQLCPYKQTGIFMRLPPPINCTSNVIQNWSRQQAAVYRRHLIPLNATFCSKYTRTVCTWAFLRWSLQVVSDVHSIDSVPLKDCQKLHQQKRLGSIELQSTNSSHKWTSRNPVHYSYAFFGEDCQSTVNYAVEEGEVVLFDGHSSIDSFTRTKGCSPKQNHCFTAHETIMWNISDLHSQCQYKLDGIYTAQVSSTEIFVHILQEAFVIIPKQPALLQGCHITNPVYTENDIVISFDSPETHDPLQDDDAVAQEESRIFMLEKIKGRPNIINPVLQYLQDIERKRNALKWCSVKNEFHAIVRWISIRDPTSAVRLLLGRSDVSARQVGHTLLVSKCHRVPATDIRWDHHRNGKCFERLPVTIDGRNVFVEPYTHDVVTESQELSCTLYKLPVNVSEIADNNLEILTNRTIQTIFNAKQPKDISLQFIHLALDHLQSSNLAYEESSTTNQTQRSWWTSSEEQLKELGHQVEKTTEEISQTLISVAHYWRWITAGGALVITAAAAVFICVQCPVRRCKRHAEKPQSVEINLKSFQVKELQTPFSQQELATDAEMSDSPPLQTTDRTIRPLSHYPYKPPAIPNSLRGHPQRKQNRNSSNL